MAWSIKYFRTAAGEMPARVFRMTLPPPLRSKLDRMTTVTAETSGTIGGGIFESFHAPYTGLMKVRAKREGDLVRYVCIVDGDSLVLLEGVRKRLREPTPTAILDRARGYYTEYLEKRDAVGGMD